MAHLADDAARNPYASDFDLVLTKTEDARDSWRIFYDTREYAETGDFRHGLVGNRPLLVSKVTGFVCVDSAWRTTGDLHIPAHGIIDRATGRVEPIDSEP